MRRLALVCCSVLLTHGLLGAERTAGAATISSITYTVKSGGSFGNIWNHLGWQGPVTGNIVEYRAPAGGVTTTSFFCNLATATDCGQLYFNLTGPSVFATYSYWTFPVGTVTITKSRFFGQILNIFPGSPPY